MTAPTPIRPPSLRERGFTTVELLIGLLLGLFLLAGVVSIFTASRESFRVNENLTRVQEDTRFAFEVMVREIRESGNVVCGNRGMANVISATPDWWADWGAGTIVGYDDTTAAPAKAIGTATAERVTGTDAITVLRPVSDEATIQPVTAHDEPAYTLTVDSGTGFKADDYVVVCDSKTSALLKVATVSGDVLSYGSGNCSNKLGYPTPASCTSPGTKVFDPDAMVTKYEPVFWYVGNNSAGGRSLFRLAPTVQAAAQEMVAGVTNMQIEYLYRDGAASNALSTDWVSASNVAFTGAGTWTPTNPKQAVAVRLSLTFQTSQKVGTDGNALTRTLVAVAALRSRDNP